MITNPPALPRTTESAESAAFWAWRDLHARRYPALALAFHPVNEGKRNPRKVRGMGISAGLPDIMCPARRGIYTGWARELKVGKASPTEAQWNWLARLKAEGWDTGVIAFRAGCDWTNVARSLCWYLGIDPAGVGL